jgi:serine/threonine protein kinase
MDYVNGTAAAQLIANRFPTGMPAGQVLATITAVADALDYAHSRGMLHRNVKPGNILFTNPADGEQRILLTDFGIARQLGDPDGPSAPELTGETVAYAAPEQLMGSEIDGRADQYALAATAYDWTEARAAAGINSSSHDDMHAGELETSILLATYPDYLRPGWHASDHTHSDRRYLTTVGMHAYTDTGVIGQPSLATADKGRALLDHLAKAAHPLIALLTGGQH